MIDIFAPVSAKDFLQHGKHRADAHLAALNILKAIDQAMLDPRHVLEEMANFIFHTQG